MEQKERSEEYATKLQSELFHVASKAGKEAFNTSLNKQYQVLLKHIQRIESEARKDERLMISEYLRESLKGLDNNK